jgi:hypothetical protein
MPESIEFEASYDDSTIDQAARAFYHHQFMKYRWIIVSACIVNFMGFIAVWYFGVRDWMLFSSGLIAVVGPAYFSWAYFHLPKSAAAQLRSRVKPSARVTVSPFDLTMSTRTGRGTVRWTSFKELVELPDYFLLAISPYAFVAIPKKDAPDEAREVIRLAMKRERAA